MSIEYSRPNVSSHSQVPTMFPPEFSSSSSSLHDANPTLNTTASNNASQPKLFSFILITDSFCAFKLPGKTFLFLSSVHIQKKRGSLHLLPIPAIRGLRMDFIFIKNKFRTAKNKASSKRHSIYASPPHRPATQDFGVGTLQRYGK